MCGHRWNWKYWQCHHKDEYHRLDVIPLGLCVYLFDAGQQSLVELEINAQMKSTKLNNIGIN